MKYLLLILLSAPAFSATAVVDEDLGVFDLYRGTSRISTWPTLAACKAAAVATDEARSWTCRNIVRFRTETVIVEPPPPPPPPPPTTTWTQAAREGERFRLYAPALVRYGLGSAWSEPQQRQAGEVVCENSAFGDPAPGVWKACEVSPGSALRGSPPVDPPPPPPVTGSAALTWRINNATAGALRLEYGRGDFATVVPVTGTGRNLDGLASGIWQFRLVETVAGQDLVSNVVTKVIP